MPYPTYSVATDTAFGVVDVQRLHSAVVADAGAPPDFLGFSVSGDVLTALAATEPTAGQKAAVDAVVAAHDGRVLSPLVIHQVMSDEDKRRDVRVVDYKTGILDRLHKKLTTIFRGEVRQVDYYLDDTETDLVLRVEVSYVRDASGIAKERTTTRTWFREDGTAYSPTKITKKVYDNFHAANEGNRRRENVIGILKLDVLKMLIVTRAVDPLNPTQAEIESAEADGITYFAKYDKQIALYLETGDLSFKVPPANPNITDDTEAWLNNNVQPFGWTGPTIRDEILNALKSITDP